MHKALLPSPSKKCSYTSFVGKTDYMLSLFNLITFTIYVDIKEKSLQISIV